MDIKLQFFFCNLVIWNAALDQCKNAIIRTYYEQLGLDYVFNVWWIVFWLDNIGKYKFIRIVVIHFRSFRFKTVIQHEGLSLCSAKFSRILRV